MSQTGNHQVKIDGLLKELADSPADTVVLRILNDLSWEYVNTEPEKARDYAYQALKLGKNVLDNVEDEQYGTRIKSMIARSLNSLANINEVQGNYEKAIGFHLRSLTVSSSVGDKHGIGATYGNLGVVYQHQGNYDKALFYYLKSLKIDEEINASKAVGINLNNIGVIYLYQREYEQAMNYCLRSLRLREEIKDVRGIYTCLHNIGTIYMGMKEYENALKHFKRALEINEELGDRQEYAHGLTGIGAVFYYNEDLDSALVYYKRSLLITEELNDKYGSAANLHNIGEMYLKQLAYFSAIEFFQRSLRLSSQIGARDYVRSTHEYLSLAYEGMQQYEKAHAHYMLHSSIKDSLFNEQKSKEIGKLEAQYEFEKAEEIKKQLEQEAIKLEKEKKSRRDNLQYSGILIFLVVLGIALVALGRISISVRMAEGIIFFSFLLLFEFCLVLLDPYIERFSSGAPALKLMFNAGLAAMIFPLHSLFENKLKQRLIK